MCLIPMKPLMTSMTFWFFCRLASLPKRLCNTETYSSGTQTEVTTGEWEVVGPA